MPHDHHHENHARDGAKQPERFDPARAARLDDPARFDYVPVDAALVLLDAAPGATICDFGTGTGTYAIEIAHRRPDLRILALDEQPEMLALLRAKPLFATVPNVHPLMPDDLAPEVGRVDRIFALNVLHELGDDALASLATLLTPNGSALFIDWNAVGDRPVGPPAEHVYSPEAAAERLRAAGFGVTMHGPFPYHYALSAMPLRVP